MTLDRASMENKVEKIGLIHREDNKNLNKNSHFPRRILQGNKPKHLISLNDHEIPSFKREPYIKSGYRFAENITVRQCLATLFTIHNETFNIWSHLLAALGTFILAVNYFSYQPIIGNPMIYPLICFLASCIIVLLTSAFAHLFSCMSWKARHFCFYADYASISVFTFSSCLSYIFYSRPLDEHASILHQNPYIFIAISITMAPVNMYFSCLSRHRLLSIRFIIRTGLNVVKLLFDTSPFISRCFASDSVCNGSTMFHFKRQMLFYAVVGIVYALRVPERFSPGLFDLLGHSHHIFHVLIIIVNYDAASVYVLEMESRKVELESSPFQPTFFTTFGLLIALMLVNVSILSWFVNNWLTTEEEELFVGDSKYHVIYRKTDYDETDEKNQ